MFLPNLGYSWPVRMDLWSAVALSLFLWGCPGDLTCPNGSTDLDSCFGTVAVPPCDEEIDVPRDIFGQACGSSSCHEGADPDGAGLDLVSPGAFDRMVNQPAVHENCTDRTLVVRGEPDESFLLQKILGQQGVCGDPMPQIGALTGQQIACVRRWILSNSLGLAPDAGPRPDAGVRSDGATPPADSGMPADSAMPPTDAMMSMPDAAMMPVDCSAIDNDANKDLCSSSMDTCEAVFLDNTSCAETCGLVGLTCQASYENIDGMCAANMGAPLNCEDLSHMSDYCVCTR